MNTKAGQEPKDIAVALEASLASVEGSLTLKKIRDRLDRIDMSADAKALLLDIASLTIKLGERIVAIGRKIVTVALDLIRRFPNTAFGVVIALVLGALVASAFGGLPLIGAILAAKLKAIMLLFGIAKGAIADMSRQAIGGEVEGFVNELSPIALAV